MMPKQYLNQEKVFTFVSEIPKGKVSTYKKVACETGVGSPRVVGNILHQNPDPIKVPCHRVVHSDGTLAESFAFGGEMGQKKKLESEGVVFVRNKVNSQYLV